MKPENTLVPITIAALVLEPAIAAPTLFQVRDAGVTLEREAAPKPVEIIVKREEPKMAVREEEEEDGTTIGCRMM